jgi:hypothetical protein
MNMWAAISKVWTFVKNHPHTFWSCTVLALGVAFVLVVIQPFSRTVPELTAQDVATSWNQSISLLGIRPIFPPAEDFAVGDVWAVVAESDDLPLLGQSVRIAHLDLRDGIRAAQEGQLIFADTVEIDKATAYRKEPPAEVGGLKPDDDRIVLTLAGFPGITISHTIKAGAGFGIGTANLGASRDSTETEEITIPTAETYGAPPDQALIKLDQWCRAPESSLYCTDQYARRILAFSVSTQVLAAKNGAYTSNLQLRLVTRVFLTREIQHRRIINDSRNGTVTLVADAGLVGGPPPNQNAGSRAAASADAASPKDAQPGKSDAGASSNSGSEPQFTLINTGGAGMQLRQTFQRPVAFGYRAVTITLEPSKPSGESLP